MNKDTLADLIEKYQKKVKEWDWPIYSMVQERLDDLQHLQAEQPKQEADIDKIMEEADRLSNVWAMDYWINIPRNRLREIITKHLTQKTTVPKDGEVVEISKNFLKSDHCCPCWAMCRDEYDNFANYCPQCGKEIKRID